MNFMPVRQKRPSKILGVAITERAFLVAEITGSGDRRDLRRCGEFRFPEGTSLANIPALSRPFSQFLRQNGFTSRQMVVGLPTNWLLVKSKEVPPSTAAMAANMLRLQAESDFSSELADLVYDYAGPRQGRVLMMDNLKVQVTAKAINWNIAQSIQDRLRSGGKFKNVTLLDQREAGHTTGEVSFAISFDYSGPEAPHGRH